MEGRDELENNCTLGVGTEQERDTNNSSSMGALDVLALFYMAFLAACLIVSNRLFLSFIAAKPEGRKTAIGKFLKEKKLILRFKIKFSKHDAFILITQCQLKDRSSAELLCQNRFLSSVLRSFRKQLDKIKSIWPPYLS